MSVAPHWRNNIYIDAHTQYMFVAPMQSDIHRYIHTDEFYFFFLKKAACCTTRHDNLQLWCDKVYNFSKK